jgi:hypothetical protein
MLTRLVRAGTLTGGYWRWGRKELAAPGPIGPNLSEANDGTVSEWNTTVASDGSWSDFK